MNIIYSTEPNLVSIEVGDVYLTLDKAGKTFEIENRKVIFIFDGEYQVISRKPYWSLTQERQYLDAGYYLIDNIGSSGAKQYRITASHRFNADNEQELQAEIREYNRPKSGAERKQKEREAKRAQGLTEIPRIGWVKIDDVDKIKSYAASLSSGSE